MSPQPDAEYLATLLVGGEDLRLASPQNSYVAFDQVSASRVGTQRSTHTMFDLWFRLEKAIAIRVVKGLVVDEPRRDFAGAVL